MLRNPLDLSEPATGGAELARMVEGVDGVGRIGVVTPQPPSAPGVPKPVLSTAPVATVATTGHVEPVKPAYTVEAIRAGKRSRRGDPVGRSIPSIRFALILTAMLSAAAGPARAQAPQVPQASPSAATETAAVAAAVPVTAPAFPTLLVVAGGSTVVQTAFPVTHIAVTNPDIADATVVDPNQVLVDGKTSGSVSLIVWGAQHMVQYAVVVFPPTPSLQRQFGLLFPGEDIHVSVADEAIVLSGRTSSSGVATHAVEIAEKSSAKSKVISLLQVPRSRPGTSR